MGAIVAVARAASPRTPKRYVGQASGTLMWVLTIGLNVLLYNIVICKGGSYSRVVREIALGD